MVNKIIFKFPLLIIVLFAFAAVECKKDKSCPESSHNYILIKNNSSIIINWKLFRTDSIYTLNGQPYDNIVLPSQSDNYAIREETCWEEYFRTVNYGFQYFLIFDNDTVQAIGWEKISGTDRGLLKRVKVDLEYLQNNNFTITYP